MSILPPEIAEIVKEQALAWQSVVTRAYEAGKAVGKAEAEAAIRDKLASVLNLQEAPVQTPEIAPHGVLVDSPKPRGSGRAAPRAPARQVFAPPL